MTSNERWQVALLVVAFIAVWLVSWAAFLWVNA